MPLATVWYFGPVDGNGMVTCHDAVVLANYGNGKKKLAYVVGEGDPVIVDQVPHYDWDYHAETFRTKIEAGEDCVDGGMSSFR